MPKRYLAAACLDGYRLFVGGGKPGRTKLTQKQQALVLDATRHRVPVAQIARDLRVDRKTVYRFLDNRKNEKYTKKYKESEAETGDLILVKHDLGCSACIWGPGGTCGGCAWRTDVRKVDLVETLLAGFVRYAGGGASGRTILSRVQQRKIISDINEGKTIDDVALEMGVTVGVIERLVSG